LTAGGRPSTALARGAGLEVRRGIVVDDHLASPTDPRIHALGDCAEHRGVTTGFVPPAWEQAQLLAARLCGADVVHEGSRSVARLRATDLDVAVLGDPVGEEGEVVEVSNPVAGKHSRLVVRDGVIVAAALVGDLSRVGLITQHYDRGTVLGVREPDGAAGRGRGVRVRGGVGRGDPGLRRPARAARDHPCHHRLRWLRGGLPGPAGWRADRSRLVSRGHRPAYLTGSRHACRDLVPRSRARSTFAHHAAPPPSGRLWARSTFARDAGPSFLGPACGLVRS
ncbi:MAG: FAD-dependent oxidoreductase, partial [Nocardioides sp.]